ncbi:MAG: hypothetical protein A2Y11_02675 [Planctomycetes bacterium GWC2_39_26]|nr:MAG: hypothetical protein A2Y11_02675 [Planctomycetes bacterium GWC2_39_26]HJZ24007.1 hypothetical protein [Candidatus Babeliales bacterium]
MTRFLVLLIAAYVIYYLFKNSLRSKTKRNALQSNKGENTDVVNTHLKEIAYVFYSTAKDRDTCDTCLALDGKHLLPNHKILNDIKPPHVDCRNPKGCRCTLVYVTRDEDGSKEVETLLKRRGGLCDRQTIDWELRR